jgi:hypothetical protein
MCSNSPADARSLFSAERRPIARRDRWLQSDYQRLDRAIGESGDRIRRLIDEWYARLPPHSRAEIRQRFADRSTATHLGAFWELYLHEAGRCLGFDVDIDVGRDVAGRRPDLLLGRQADSFFMEATVALGDGVIRRDQQPRADQLYAAIDRVENRDFLIHTQLERVGHATPGRKVVTAPLDRWLAGLDPDALRQAADSGGAAPGLMIEKDGWRVRFEATGLKPELRGDPDASVVGARVHGFADDPAGEDLMPEIDDITPLTNALLKKAGHGYEIGDRPFVIAVLCAGELIDDHDIAQALFGPIEYAVSMSSDRAVGQVLPGGLWHEGAGARYTTVSAVLTASNLSPGGVADVEPCLWLNPAAANPLEPTSLPWRRYEITTQGRVGEHPARLSVAEIFGLHRYGPQLIEGA